MAEGGGRTPNPSHLPPRNLAFRSLRYFLTAFLSSDNCSWEVPLICSRRRNRVIGRQISGSRLHQRRCKLSLSFWDRQRRSTCCLRQSFPFCSPLHFWLCSYWSYPSRVPRVLG